MVSRICEKQKKDQTIEDLFVITVYMSQIYFVSSER